MPIEHMNPTIGALAEAWFLGPEIGPKYGNLLKRKFNARADQQAIDDALALGGYLVHSDSNKRQRHALRAVLLANFLMKNQPVSLRDRFHAQYKSASVDQLKQAFTHLFPAFIDNDNRAAWAPVYFTRPAALRDLQRPADWTRRSPPPYKLFIHTLKHPSATLNAPIQTLSRWIAISMSVLSSRNPVAYSNHGVILRVPENNVLTTSPTDQWFDNYAGTSSSTKAPGQSMAKHIAEKNIMLGGLLTPDEVVGRQGTPEAMQHSAGAAQTQHNEVVVCGVPNQPLPHGTTEALELVGVFIQTRMDGSLPDVYMKSQGRAKQIELAVVACARNYHVPMFYLPTNRL